MNLMISIGITTLLILCFCPITSKKGYHVNCNLLKKFCLFTEAVPFNFLTLTEYDTVCKNISNKSRPVDARPVIKTNLDYLAKHLYFPNIVLNAEYGDRGWIYIHDEEEITFEEEFVIKGDLLLYQLVPETVDKRIYLICMTDCRAIFNERKNVGISNWPDRKNNDHEVIYGTRQQCEIVCDDNSKCVGFEISRNYGGKCMFYFKENIPVQNLSKSTFYAINRSSTGTMELCLDRHILTSRLLERPKKPTYTTKPTTIKTTTTTSTTTTTITTTTTTTTVTTEITSTETSKMVDFTSTTSQEVSSFDKKAAAVKKSDEPWEAYLIACIVTMVVVMCLYGLTRKNESEETSDSD